MMRNFILVFVSLVSPVHLYANEAVWTISEGGNGHTYRAVATDDIEWEEANTMAQNLGGYLVTITSKEENAFVFNLINEQQYWTPFSGRNSGPWIGGFQPKGSKEPDGGWRWVTDEGLLSETFENWNPGEPNDFGANNEKYISFWSPDADRRSGWNDTVNDSPTVAFVVEFDFEILSGDINLDGVVDLLDVCPFTQLLSKSEYRLEADLNCDGSVDLLDVAPFVDLLIGG